MSEAREFWVLAAYRTARNPDDNGACFDTPQGGLTHVIEYSAYTAAQAENAALKEKLALAVETLEKYRKARFSHGDSMKMADDCLKRISGEAGE